MALWFVRLSQQALTTAFFDELSAVFEQLATYRCAVVVCGDFNIHVDQPNDVHAMRLSQLLQSFDCQQHVDQPTHTAGHTLDLVITHTHTSVSDLCVGDFISDHALVSFKLEGVLKSPAAVNMLQRRAWRRLSLDAFASDLQTSALCQDLDSLADMSVEAMASLYDSVLTGLLDHHCPSVTVRHKVQPMTPWFDAECRTSRRRVRAAERRFKRTYLVTDRHEWMVKCSELRALYEQKNSTYWQNEIAACAGDSKKLWNVFHTVLGETRSVDTDLHTADEFAAFFKDKVESVRAFTDSTPLYEVPFRMTTTLERFASLTVEEVDKLIRSAPCKTCQLDPVPTWLVKEVSALISPFVSMLLNKSLADGCFPSTFKRAVVRPLLKKTGLDASQLKNYRPVSNLSFLSKLLERAVQVRLQAFLDNNDMLPASQSAYRQFHSTETAVLKVYNDLLLAADSGQVSALCLLDLTAAFDTVDHDLLMLRLERQFGLRGVVLQWFRSYLSDRSFRVVLGSNSSSVIRLLCSVPQGSVLGPRMFIMYMADLADFVGQRQVNFHSFADDTQTYLHCLPVDVDSAVCQLEGCISDIGHWMSANRLKLNTDKTELLWTGSKYNLSLLGGCGPSLQLGDDVIKPSDYVRLLGVTVAADLGLDRHVSNVCKTCFFWLRQLRRVRRSLDIEGGLQERSVNCAVS